jgi:2-(1,2-epoxy-1,2-dihydrophenyl)acetyl-CoA isomerase
MSEDNGVNDEARILVSVDGAVGTLTLNRPEKLNSFVDTMRDELAEGLESLARDDRVRAVIVTGRGRAFCTGADIRYLSEMVESDRSEEFRSLVEAGRRVVLTIAEMPKPVIAAINGPAAGGGANLALACDLRWASDRASIGQTFSNIGLHPDWGGAYFVPRLVGPARAAELFFFGEMVDAQTALEIGLLNRVVPHDDLMDDARQVAERLAARPALALRLAKQAVRRSLAADIEEMLQYELEAQAACFRTADALEGTRAFLEKRAPRFGGRSAEEASGEKDLAAAAAAADEAR